MKLSLTLFIFMHFCFSTFAQDLNKQAETYFQQNDWPNVVKAYTSLVKQDPSNAQSWYRLGRGYHETEKFKEALNAYNEAEQRGFSKLSIDLRKAKSYSMLNNTKEAMDSFKLAVDQGFNDPTWLTDDKELASLKQDSRYDAVLNQVKRNAKPCGYDPEFRQFDFWVGDWEVFNAGALAGKSKIELILKDCVIVENYESASYAYSGKSYNVYNPGIKKWQQFYVDTAAGPTLYIGEFVNGEMRFNAESVNPDGTKVLNKMIFYNLGADKVRQHIQQSTDSGKTWTNFFDGEYRRIKNEK